MTSRDDETLSEALAALGIRHERDAGTDGDGRRAWFSREGLALGRYDFAEGWKMIVTLRDRDYAITR